MTSPQLQGRNRAETIRAALGTAFSPTELRVLDESGNHNVAPGSQSHFRVLVASTAFEGKNRVARHRLIHQALSSEFDSGLHALAIDAFTPDEWADRAELSTSPECLGGSKHSS